jgi:uncharacterized membrane protein YphA (DoxX/SURF4 family)
VATFVELVGGALLIVGLLSRLSALLLIIDLVVAILLLKVYVGLLSPPDGGIGAELDLALIAGFLVILLAGPGRFSRLRARHRQGRSGSQVVPKVGDAQTFHSVRRVEEGEFRPL